MKLALAFKRFFSGFDPGVRLERQMHESRKAFAREMERRLPALPHTSVVRKVARWFLGLFAVALLFALFGQVAPLVFPESQWAYELKYNTDEKHVYIASKPTDCDWTRAPLGDKGCRYEKTIEMVRYSTDAKTGKPIVTWDDGKTWHSLATGEKPGPVQIYVTWRKVQD